MNCFHYENRESILNYIKRLVDKVDKSISVGMCGEMVTFGPGDTQWHSLSREEQAKYYEKARQERQLHMQLYPGWSARDNYGYGSKKKKRKKDRSPAELGGIGSDSTGDVTSDACVHSLLPSTPTSPLWSASGETLSKPPLNVIH